MIRGTIKLGKPTASHKSVLEKCGYKVEEANGFLHVEGTEFINALDLSGDDDAARAALVSIVRGKKLLTYGSKMIFRTTDGEVRELSSLPAVNTMVSLCKRLGIPNLSALVVKPEGGGKKAAASPEGEADFFAAIAE